MNTRVSHHDLPTGTVLHLRSQRGNVFRVELLDGVFEGHSRRVLVLEAPIQYNPSAEPTIMCVVPADTPVDIMGEAYAAATATVGVGDKVYLIDRFASGPVDYFDVAELTVE